MYRLLSLALVLTVAPSAFAQTYAIDKGSYLLGGTVSFTSTGGDTLFDEDERLTEFSINPDLAYFVIPGLALGANVSYSRISERNFSFTTIGIGPSIAYYFGGPANKAYPFVAGSVLYASSDGDISGFGSELAGGVSYMIARNVGLTGEAFYRLSRLSGDVFPGVERDFDSNTFGLRGGVTAFIF